MLLQEMMSEERMAGRKEGLEIGRQEGLEAGRRESLDKMNQLIILLSEQNRKDDIIKAANNKEFQKQLFREFHLYTVKEWMILTNDKEYRKCEQVT